MKRTYETLAEEQRLERHKEELASDLELASNDEDEAPAAGVTRELGDFQAPNSI